MSEPDEKDLERTEGLGAGNGAEDETEQDEITTQLEALSGAHPELVEILRLFHERIEELESAAGRKRPRKKKK